MCTSSERQFFVSFSRHLPMIAAQLRGRVHLKSKEFANQQHILVFSHILGVLDLLRPHIFRQDKVSGLLVTGHTTHSVSLCYLGRFHTMPEEFKNASLFFRLGLPSTLIHYENGAFQKRYLPQLLRISQSDWLICRGK